MRWLIIGVVLATTALAPIAAYAQMRERTREDVAGDDRPRRDREDRTRPNRRFDGDGARFARPDRNVERKDGQVFPPTRDRRDDRRVESGGWWTDRRDTGGWSSWGRDAYRGGQVWNPGWREDRRYDWNRHRDHNHDLYRLPRYYPPRGYDYRYRRFGLGVTLPRALLYDSYWLDDPWSYRLPPVHGPYRWVRYHGDALLVDLRTGRVIDVVHDIFH